MRVCEETSTQIRTSDVVRNVQPGWKDDAATGITLADACMDVGENAGAVADEVTGTAAVAAHEGTMWWRCSGGSTERHANELDKLR